MHCVNKDCNHELEPDSQFCTQCGTPQPDPGAVTERESSIGSQTASPGLVHSNPNNRQHEEPNADGQESYTEALRITLQDDRDSGARALPLFLRAIEKGLGNAKDEAMAYAYVASIYIDLGPSPDWSNACEYFKKAFALKSGLTPDPEFDYYWDRRRKKFAAALCVIGKDAEKVGDWDTATSMYLLRLCLSHRLCPR